MFGAGEAGAYPNASCVVSRWFPAHQRAKAQGIIFMASRLGGALSPLLVYPLILVMGLAQCVFCFQWPWSYLGSLVVALFSGLSTTTC